MALTPEKIECTEYKYMPSPTPADEKGADWNKLRDKFFKECTKMDSVDGCMIKIDYAPHDLFEWFKKQFATAPQQEAAQGYEVDSDFTLWVVVNKWEYDYETHEWINNYIREFAGASCKHSELYNIFKSQL